MWDDITVQTQKVDLTTLSEVINPVTTESKKENDVIAIVGEDNNNVVLFKTEDVPGVW